MRKIAVLVTAAALTVLAIATIVRADQHQDNQDNGVRYIETDEIETRGVTDFVRNRLIYSTLAFYPENIQVNQGDELTIAFRDDDQDPHTLTIIDPEDLPTTIAEVFGGCQPCNEALQAHFPGDGMMGEGDEDPQDGLPSPGDIVAVIDEGEEGLDTAGDSIFFFPGETVSTTVSAEPGTTLYYVCAIHPWMQGSIKVAENGDGG